MENVILSKLISFSKANTSDIDILINHYRQHPSKSEESRLEQAAFANRVYLNALNDILPVSHSISYSKDIKQKNSKESKWYKWVNKNQPSKSTHLVSFNMLAINNFITLNNSGVIKINNNHFYDFLSVLAYNYKPLKFYKTYLDIIVETGLKGQFSKQDWERFKFLMKFIINFTYGTLGSSKYNIHCKDFHLISRYSWGFYEILKTFLPTQINKIDTDEVYLNSCDGEVINKIRHVANLMGVTFDIQLIQ